MSPSTSSTMSYSSQSLAATARGSVHGSSLVRKVPTGLQLPLNHGHDNYFGDNVYESPTGSDDDDDDDDDAQSDSTCEDDDRFQFGAPLERMPRQHSGRNGLVYDKNQQVTALLKVSPCSSGLPSRCGSFISEGSNLSYDCIDYDEVIGEMISDTSKPFLLNGFRNLVPFKPLPGSRLSQLAGSGPPLMVKTLSRSAPELLLLLELNHRDSREDPWNPVPHILSAVERQDAVYLCMQGLNEYNDSPLLTVAHYIDFFRQVLEGLTFLHEQRVAGLSCSDPASYMVDLSSAPQSLIRGDPYNFDRFSFPVRYYFVNFSDASRIPREMRSPLSNPGTPGDSRRRPLDPYKIDVQDLGAMLDSLLLEVPQVSQKFKPLIRAMTAGGFAADDARKLFEALCRTLEAHVFESKAALFTKRSAPERAHTLAHPLSANVLSPRFPPLEKICSH